MPSIREFKRTVDRWGLFRLLWAAFMHRVSPWLTLCQVQTRRNAPREETSVTEGSLRIGLAARDDLYRAVAEMPDQLDADFVESALARGDICAAAFDDSRIVSFQWASFTTARVNDRLSVKFTEPFRYGYKGFTDPAYRGRRIAREVMLFCDSECLARGYTHTIVYVETHNYASIANLDRLGNRCIGYTGYFKVGRRYFPFRTPGAKRCGFRFYGLEKPEG